MSYKGDTIDPLHYLDAVHKQAQQSGFVVHTLGYCRQFPLYWLERQSNRHGAPSVLLSTGVHGDEPAGPLSILRLLSEDASVLSQSVRWCISPMLNPTGFNSNTRENEQGIDLNRDFLNTRSDEVNLLKQQLENQDPFDLALMLHEDWESSGFYLYDLDSNPNPELAKKIVSQVGKLAAIDTDETIDGMAAKNGIISVDIDQAESDPKLEGQWPEAFYLLHKNLAARQYTIESASSFEMSTRVKSLVTAVEVAVSYLPI